MQGNLKGWWKDFKGWRILHCIACICMFHHLDAFTIERICLTGGLCFYKIGGGPPPCVEITRFVPPTQQKVETRWRKYAKSLKVCRYAENLKECWKDLKGWRILHCIACICMFHHLDAFTIERICLTGDLCFYKIGGGHPPVWNNKVCATAKSGDQVEEICKKLESLQICREFERMLKGSERLENFALHCMHLHAASSWCIYHRKNLLDRGPVLL